MNLKSAFRRFILRPGQPRGMSQTSQLICHLPSTLIVEESICALLILFGNLLRLFVSLEPCLILLVKPPTLVLERPSGKPLLIGVLSIVEDVE